MGNEPLEHTFITKRILAQVLDHAWSLLSEIFHGLCDEVEIQISNPLGVVSGDLTWVSVPTNMHTLSLQHVKYTIDGAESPCTPTAGTAMHKYRPLAPGFWLLAVKARVAGVTDDLVALLNQMKKMSRL